MNAYATRRSCAPAFHIAQAEEANRWTLNNNIIQSDRHNIFERKVEINKKKLDLKQKENRIRGSLKAVDAERKAHPERYQSQVVTATYGMGGTVTYEKNDNLMRSNQQKQIHQKRLKENQSQRKILDAEDNFLDSEIKKNTKLQQQYKKVEKKNIQVTDTTSSNTPSSTTHTMTEKERKAAEKAKKKREEEARKAAAKRKADMKKELDDAKKSNQAEELEAKTQTSTTTRKPSTRLSSS